MTTYIRLGRRRWWAWKSNSKRGSIGSFDFARGDRLGQFYGGLRCVMIDRGKYLDLGVGVVGTRLVLGLSQTVWQFACTTSNNKHSSASSGVAVILHGTTAPTAGTRISWPFILQVSSHDLPVPGMISFQQPYSTRVFTPKNTLLLSKSHHLLASFSTDPCGQAIPGTVCSRIYNQRFFFGLVLVASPFSSGGKPRFSICLHLEPYGRDPVEDMHPY